MSQNRRLTERHLYVTENSGHLDHRVAVLHGRTSGLRRKVYDSHDYAEGLRSFKEKENLKTLAREWPYLSSAEVNQIKRLLP